MELVKTILDGQYTVTTRAVPAPAGEFHARFHVVEHLTDIDRRFVFESPATYADVPAAVTGGLAAAEKWLRELARV